MCYSTRQLQRSRFIGTLIALALILFAAQLHAAGGSQVWQASDPRVGKQEAAASVVDTAGNVIVAGYQFQGSGTDDAYYVTKFKADGSGPLWSKSYNHGSGQDRATAVTVDSAGNVVVVGKVWNGVNYDIHTIKYMADDGAVGWSHTYNGSAGGNDIATSVAVDAADNVYVGGYSANASGNDDFLILKYPAGGSTTPQKIVYNDPVYNSHDRINALAIRGNVLAATGYSSKGGSDFDILTLKYDLTGTVAWATRRSSPGSFMDQGAAVAVDNAGNVFVAGYLAYETHKDLYLAKYDDLSSGHLVWETAYDGGFDDEARALTLDNNGNPVVTGYSWTLDGKFDTYTAKHAAADGARIWGKIYNSGSDNTDLGYAVLCDPGGDVYVTGRRESGGVKSFQTLKYAAVTGNLLWTAVFNGVAGKSAEPAGIGLAADGDIYVAGWSDTWTGGASDFDFQLVKYNHGAMNRPTDLTAKAVSNTEIELIWTDNSTNEDEFVIERKLGDGGAWGGITANPLPISAGRLTVTDNNLAPGNYYYYRVQSRSATLGSSAFSNEARALTKVISYDSPVWSFQYGSPSNREDIATAIAVGPDDHPVVTGFSDLDEAGLEGEVGVSSYDFVTIKLNRADKSQVWPLPLRHDSGSGGTDMAAAIAADGDNNVIVSGSSYLAVPGEDIDSMFTLKYPAAGGLPIWSDQYNGPGLLGDYVRALATAVDASGNLAVAGYSKRTPTNDDIHLLKYTAAGTRVWPHAATFDGGGNDQPASVAFDPAGNVFVTGYTFNTVRGDFDFYTAKYAGANGDLLWSDIYNGPANRDDKGVAIVVDNAGNAYVTGSVSLADNTADFLTIKYDGANTSAKRRIWEKQYNGPANGNDQPVSIKIDPIDGAVLVAGTSTTAPGDGDLHLVRYRGSDGELLWERNLDRPASDDRAVAMAVDSSGYIYVAGTSGVGTAADALSLVYDFEGTLLGAVTYDGGFEDRARAIAVNYQGEAFIAGSTRKATLDADYLVYKQKNNYIMVPAPFTASSQADHAKINLSWRQNTPDTSFRVERTLGPVNSSSVWDVIAEPASGTTAYQDTGRTGGTTYCYRISAFSGSLNSRKIETCAATTLAAPVLNAPVGDSTIQISLSWNNVAGNTGYRIERRTGTGGNWDLLAVKTANDNSHADTPLAPGTTYYYRIYTNSSSGYSLQSNEGSAITKPAAPSLDTLTVASTSQINLSWSVVTGAASYTLQYRSDSGSFADYPACTAIAGSGCSVTGLSDATRYYFRVKAANAAGDSAWSGTPSAYTLLPTPTLTTVSMPSATTVSLSWTDVAGEAGYKIQQSYCYYPNDVSFCNSASPGSWPWSGWGDLVTGLPADGITHARAHGMSAGYGVSYRVIATNANTVSNPSNNIKSKVWFSTPSSPTILPASESSLAISWNDITGETNYALQRKLGTGGVWGDVAGATAITATAYTDNGLALSTRYCYRVKAYSSESYAPPEIYSDETCKTTPLPTPVLAAPVVASATQITISWGHVTGNNGYTVERCQSNYLYDPAYTGSFGSCATLPMAADVEFLNDSGLTAGYTYSYRVQAKDAAGEYSAFSAARYATTYPLKPLIGGVSPLSSSQLYISWGNVYGNTGYTLEWKPRTGSDCTAGTWNSIPIGQNSWAYSHAGRSPGTWYCYQVRANGPSGNSSFSDPVAQITLLPPPVLNTITTVSGKQVSLSWTNIPGNSGYVPQYSSNATDWIPLSTTAPNAEAAVVTLPSYGTFYSFRLLAVNPAGNSLPSNIQTTTTTPDTPSISLLVLSPDRVKLTWRVKTGATRYKIERSNGGPGSYSEIAQADIPYGISFCGAGYPTPTCPATSDNEVSYSDHDGLAANTDYCYRVKAWNATGGDSVPSASECQKTTDVAIPTLSATALNSMSIRLDWAYDPAGCGTVPCRSDIDQVQIERKMFGIWKVIATKLPGEAFHTDSMAITPGMPHKYRVRAFKGATGSPYSSEAVGVPPLYSSLPPTCP